MFTKVIYEIYPLTFNYAKGSTQDPHHGSYGNLKGITAAAEYIASLGVDAIWIAPFYCWNHNGFGYDITDYQNIDPMYGTLEDFKELCDVYHQHNILVLLDQVYNHCSEKNPWFNLSIKKHPKFSDFFVWHDPIGYDEEGNPIAPNNWPSTWDMSGSSAWTYCPQRKQFYMHSFDYTMPNLNINNPMVRKELLKISKHWFDLGADGFRLDATTHYGCDTEFRNNPLDENNKQMRIYDINSTIGAQFLAEMKALANSYPTPKVLLAEYVFDKGEAGNQKGEKVVRESVCDSFYIGSLKGTLADFKQKVTKALQVSPNGEKLNWAFSNHDLERAATRLWKDNFTQDKCAMLMDMLLTLPGSICIYQGDELGMPNPLNLELCKNLKRDTRDVWQIANNAWDGARSGFCFSPTSHSDMALHPDARQCKFCVENQEKDMNSVLNRVRASLKKRHEGIFKELGKVIFLELSDNPETIIFIRTNISEDHKILCMYNFSCQKVTFTYRNKEYTLLPESSQIKEL